MVEDAERYGQHTSEIAAIIARVATLTPEELEQLGLEWSGVFAVETDEELAERNDTRSAMFRARKTLEYRGVWDATYPLLRTALHHVTTERRKAPSFRAGMDRRILT
ncbi:MAG: hypothetical protein ACYCTG_06670 [Ferrimicrobium sp.]